jgi:ABC-type multidrug transport system ATPase subunit
VRHLPSCDVALDFAGRFGYLRFGCFPPSLVTGLVKQFGRFAALRGVSAEFAPKRLYAILGDNGAGKTTLLRALAGLTPPTRGSISILGTTDLRSVCSQLGYMAHPSLLYDEMSGMENLRYFARLYEISDRGQNNEDRCADVIRAVKLDPSLRGPWGNIRKACGSGCRWRARF